MTFADVPRHIEFQAAYTPNPESRAVYNKVFGEFVRFYEQTKKYLQAIE